MRGVENQGFSMHATALPRIPVLVSVPHAGRDYPEQIFSALRLPRASLVRLEDRYADLLARDVTANDVPTIIAHRARAWIDLNRDEQDLDVEMVSGIDRTNYPTPGTKQRGGLGLIPRRLSGEGDIWKCRMTAEDIEHRINSFHRPFHQAVAGTLARMRAKFGIAILLDLHSMPPIQPVNGPPARFVIGDRFGHSASGRFSEILMAQIRARGFTAALNHPYSGDHILREHAAVGGNIHALQIEVDRSLYLDSELREPGTGVATVSRLIASLVEILADEALGSETLIAAE
jgi:N-formylglutamate amidohydrolase